MIVENMISSANDNNDDILICERQRYNFFSMENKRVREAIKKKKKIID